MEIPYHISVISDNALDAVGIAKCVTLKNSALDIIHSVAIDYNDNPVVNTHDFTNVACNWRILSTYTEDKLKTKGELINFAKNDKWNYGGANIGESSAMTANTGFEKRAKTTGNNILDAENLKYMDATQLQAKRRSHYVQTSTTVHHFYMLLTIPLSELSDFFKNMPLVRRPLIKLNIKFHTADTVLAYTHAGTTLAITSVNSMYGFCPYMVGNGFLGTADSAITISSEVGGGHPIKKCYLNICTYDMEPAQEEFYFKKNSAYKVMFSQVMYKKFKSQSGAINIMVNNNQSRLRGLLLQTSAGQNGGALPSTANVVSTNNSCFSASLCMPHTHYTNLNVMLSGKKLFQNNLDYTYQQYTDMVSALSLYGDVDEITSGLITETDYSSGIYGFVYIDFSTLGEEDYYSNHSVEVIGNVNSLIDVDISSFLIYDKEITINCSDSQAVV